MNQPVSIHYISPAREEIAAAVRAHFAVRGLRDARVARELGMSQSKLSRRTTAETAFDTDDLGRIATLLGITVGELVQLPTTPQPPEVTFLDTSRNAGKERPKDYGSGVSPIVSLDAVRNRRAHA